MRTVLNFQQSVSRLPIRSLLVAALELTSVNAVNAQRQQLISGLRSDDRNIFNVITGSEYYSATYAAYKGKSHPIDLYDKGDFNKGVFAIADETGLTLDSIDDKTTLLTENYGVDIFGLGSGARVDYFYFLRPAVLNEVIDALNGH